MHLDREKLASFRAVAREGGFSRAAKVLYKTQPAISQAVRLLEEEIGEKLFLRLGRSIRLTPAGEILLEHVEDSFAAIDRAIVRIESLQALESGELTLGTSDTNACYVLPPVLAAYRRRYPGVELRLSNRPSPVTEREVLEHRVDLGFVTLPTANSKLISSPLVRREDIAIFAPNHPLARRVRLRPEELFQHPLLLLDSGSRTRSMIDRAIANCSVGVEIAMELASIEVIKRLVALDFGVSIVPEVAVASECAAGVLASARVFKRSDARSIGFITSKAAPLSRAAEAFVKIARVELSKASR
jgi:DNA-binding transcriptional LysR family regulator